MFHRDEIERKLIHMLTLLYIIPYWFMPRWFVAGGLSVVIALTVVGEILRLRSPEANGWFQKRFPLRLREGEVNRPSGLFWTLSGSLLTIMLFDDRAIVMASLLYMTFGDTFAALFGRKYGRVRITATKTYMGSAACFVACLGAGLFFLDWRLAVAGALAATVIEIVPWHLNDNFWMPIISASTLSFLSWIIL